MEIAGLGEQKDKTMVYILVEASIIDLGVVGTPKHLIFKRQAHNAYSFIFSLRVFQGLYLIHEK